MTVTIPLAQRDRAYAEQRAFHRAGNRAGIGDVVGDIVARIDARQDEIGRLRQDILDAHDDAVGRRTANGIVLVADLAQPERLRQRQRMREAGLVRLRCDHPHVVGQSARDALEALQAFRMDTVVIGEKDAHVRPPRSFQAHPYTGAMLLEC